MTDTIAHPHSGVRTGAARLMSQPRLTARARVDVALACHDDMSMIEPEWRAFEQYADCTAFQTFDWLAAWQRHVGKVNGIRPAIVLGRHGGELLFMAPLAVEERHGLNRLTWLGHDLCDYNAPLLAPNFSRLIGPAEFPALWRETLDLLQRHPRLQYDAVELEKMPETIGGQANPFVSLPVTPNPSGAYVTPLAGSWAEFYAAKRSSATRRRDRTKLKRLAEYGDISFVTSTGADDGASTLETLIRQKEKSFARMGVPNIFTRPGHAAFYRELATSAQLRHLVHVSRLDVGTTRAAANLGLTFRDCYYHVLASYDDGELGRFGPGAAHLRELLRYAMDRGLERFDFTIGDEAYKRDWCDAELKLYDHIAATTLRGWPLAVCSLAHRRLKHLIKRSPILWRTFVYARAAVGSLSRR